MTGGPLVAVVGRANVGKSTLVNRLLGRREAIEHPEPGVTRDRRAYEAEWDGVRFSIVDTGGVSYDSNGTKFYPGFSFAVYLDWDSAGGQSGTQVYGNYINGFGAGGVFSNESIDPASGSIWFGSSSCNTPGGGSSGDLWAYNESQHDQGDVNTGVFCGQNPPS